MKQLSWKLVLPMAILSMAMFSKWWYTLPVDAPQTFMRGFPLPYVATGWHTSMSMQIFLGPLLIDFLVYFGAWFLIVLGIKFLRPGLRVHMGFFIPLLVLAGLVCAGTAYLYSFPEHLFYLQREFEMEVIESGYSWFWQSIDPEAIERAQPMP